MSLKSLEKRVNILENDLLKKDLTIEDAIKLFPKDVLKFGYDFGRFLKTLGFKLEDIVTYSYRDTLGINFFHNADTYREYHGSPQCDLNDYLRQLDQVPRSET